MAEVVYDDVCCVELSEMDRGEGEEMMVNIYESADAVRGQDTSTQRETTTQQTDVRTGRCSRRAVVCVGLLCVLLLTTNIVLYVYYIRDQTINTAERETLLSSIRNLTEKRDQLKNSYQNLTKKQDQLKNSYQNLSKERDQLKNSYQNLSKERDQLKISYQNLSKERDQLKNSYQNLTEEKKILQTRYDNLVKLTVWKKNGSSFYFFSTEKKMWNDSRQDCRERGADLVIINSRKEQMFLIDQNKEKRRIFWMGLTDIHTEGTWKWVDDQPLTEQFWRKGEPNDAGNGEDCAVFTDTAEVGQRTWNDIPCSNTHNWICEVNLTNFTFNTVTEQQKSNISD